MHTNSTKAEQICTSYRFTVDGTKFVYCERLRCEEKIVLEESMLLYFYPETVIIVSANGGNNRYVYCGPSCDSKDLLGKKFA